MATPNGSIFTGTQVRTRQSPLYDSYSVLTATTVAATGLVKMFGNIDGVSGIGPDTTNMQKAFELPGGTSFLVRSLRTVFYAAAADIASFCKQFTVRLVAGGIKLLDAPADYWPGGSGVSTLASNGVNDPRAIVGFDLDPVNLTDGISFRVELVGTTFTTTAAFFLRVYLDGEITEPIIMTTAAAAAPTYVEEPCLYVFQIVLTANQALNNQKVPIDPDSDFLLTGIHGHSTGLFSVNLKLPSGRYLANTQLRSDNLVGTANQPTAIGPAPVYLAAGVGPALDITDTSAAGNTLELCFSGIRRFSV